MGQKGKTPREMERRGEYGVEDRSEGGRAGSARWESEGREEDRGEQRRHEREMGRKRHGRKGRDGST